MYICGGAIPALTGQRVKLRAMAAQDAAALYAVWCHPLVVPWLDAPPLASPEEAEELIRLLEQMSAVEESLRWSIAGPEGEVIGSCGYNNWQLQGAYRGEIGCELLPAYWGRGYMREALALVLAFGFGTMGLNRIEGLCHPDNTRAGGLFRGLGFQREGLLREYRHTAAGFQDVDLYALLRSGQL
ncbi:GNAT family N-acetyltransferase [Paenibacillus sp. HW567]|uniref:GNAT family N-acetyltransferase n=1 Tax=Paenibacillus sp. HW567 TaxID=1034769 RepID=UPI0003719261|nr:GNAT family protein [Paenibacillus sp. HW567]